MIVWLLAHYTLPTQPSMQQQIWPLHTGRIYKIGATPELALQGFIESSDPDSMKFEIVSDETLPVLGAGWPSTEGLSWRLLFTRWLTGEEWLALYPMVVKTE